MNTSEPIVYDKNQDPDVPPEVDLFTIMEQYPVKDSKDQNCKNGADYREMMQVHYNCYQNDNPGNSYRVTYDTFKDLTSLPYYLKRVTCTRENVINNVCWCPAGYTGYLCDTMSYYKSYVNITEPALYKGCKDREDSDYYVYSIQGFDPCFHFDFEKEYTIKYRIQTLGIDDKGVVLQNGHQEGVKYKYQDIVIPAVSGKENDEDVYTYASVNKKTGVKMLKAVNSSLTFDFRDWKYLSQIERFQMEHVDDVEVLLGNKEGSLQIDFNKMT